MIDFQNSPLFKLKPIPLEKGLEKVKELLVENEQIIFAFKTIRDVVVVTDKRLITANVKGVTGKRVDYSTLPFSKIQAFSVETAGSFDLDCELVLWFANLGSVRLEIVGDFDIKAFSKVIGKYIL